MDMHVVDDDTMQELLRFVKAHHTWVRHNLVLQRYMENTTQLFFELKALAEKYQSIFDKEHAAKQDKPNTRRA